MTGVFSSQVKPFKILITMYFKSKMGGVLIKVQFSCQIMCSWQAIHLFTSKFDISCNQYQSHIFLLIQFITCQLIAKKKKKRENNLINQVQ